MGWATVPMKKTLNSEPVYGGPITNESEEAWDALMPRMLPTPKFETSELTCTPDARGFVVIKNETAVPEMPKFNATMSEYKGVISVFHQLHCVVSFQHPLHLKYLHEEVPAFRFPLKMLRI